MLAWFEHLNIQLEMTPCIFVFFKFPYSWVINSWYHCTFSHSCAPFYRSFSVDGAFIDEVKQYINNGLQKDSNAIQDGTGVTGLTEIHALLANAAKPLEK